MWLIELAIITIACIVAVLYAIKRINHLVEYEKARIEPLKPKLIASRTCRVGRVENGSPVEPSWNVTCQVFSNGDIKFAGKQAQEYFKANNKTYFKYLLPLSHGAKLSPLDKRIAEFDEGVIFYD